jgi:phytoene synthase
MTKDTLLDHASQTIASGSKSFATASLLFDPATRRSAVMLYTWCRHCDDVVDGQELGFNQPAPAGDDDADARLAALIADTRRAYAGEPVRTPAFAALQEVAHRHRIPERHAQEHLAGFAMDVQGRRYHTLEDTLDYCYHVAGVVGLMMARVMGVQDEATLDRACDLGLAFQLTNIARDLVEDARMGRCYLPGQWLQEAGIPPDALADEQYRPALAQLAARLVEAAEPYYRSAQAGLPGLPLRSAWAVATAHGVYREIGVRVRASGAQAWNRRQSTSKADKLRLAGIGALRALSARVRRWPARPDGLWQRPR